jgi:hypothetical protein
MGSEESSYSGTRRVVCSSAKEPTSHPQTGMATNGLLTESAKCLPGWRGASLNMINSFISNGLDPPYRIEPSVPGDCVLSCLLKSSRLSAVRVAVGGGAHVTSGERSAARMRCARDQRSTVGIGGSGFYSMLGVRAKTHRAWKDPARFSESSAFESGCRVGKRNSKVQEIGLLPGEQRLAGGLGRLPHNGDMRSGG